KDADILTRDCTYTDDEYRHPKNDFLDRVALAAKEAMPNSQLAHEGLELEVAAVSALVHHSL
ncbi:MAG: hypothetical protein HC857_01685, partial [Synechococcales cyanobacterium RU_4_20]|nr:hypothetical protein [Synechococcales cyanobacterium RU_4_20]